MKVVPVLTEKSFSLAKDGFYTFLVERGARKKEIKRAIEDVFGVHVVSVRTIKVRPEGKKAIVTLKGEEKIDLFEEKKGKA